MSGLVKAKKYDWKDSNLALFGSDTEKQVKKESAETEPAWQGAGQEPGLRIWRIEKFEVKDWPKERYGEFYNGDSYIILNTYKDKDSDALLYDVHFWIGEYSTQDEYGTAAYKTVELDTLLDDKPVQHREVKGCESAMFKGYFKEFTTLEGGCDSGFRTVIPDTYDPRLLHFVKGCKGFHVEINQVGMCSKNINDSDVFILDSGSNICQYNGENSSGFERNKAQSYISELRGSRGGKCKAEVTENPHSFKNMLPREDDEDDEGQQQENIEHSLFRISDASSNMTFEKVKDGQATMEDFCSDDVFLYDTPSRAYVWVGRGASVDEKRNGMAYAQNYLKQTNHPVHPITVLKEGDDNRDFRMAVAA